MKSCIKIVVLLFILCFAGACSDKYDDTELRNSINSLASRVDALEKVRDAYKNKLLIESVTSTQDGYLIVFSDGSSIEIVNDKPIELPPDKDTCYIDHIEVGEDHVTFFLSDGSDFCIKMAYALTLDFNLDNQELLMVKGQQRQIPFSVSSEIGGIELEVFTSSELKAIVESFDEMSGVGSLKLMCVAVPDEYSKVVLLATNGRTVVMKRLVFTNEGIDVYDNTEKEIQDDGGQLQLEFVSSVAVEVKIPENASSWISLLPDSRSAEIRGVSLSLSPNYGSDREADVTVAEQGGSRCVTFHIKQSGNRDFGKTDERQALMDLFRGDMDVSAYADCPLKDFPGVTLDADGHVSEISTPMISAPILPSIGSLTHLKKLNIGTLSNIEDIPDEFGLLENLEHLQFSNPYSFSGAVKSFPPTFYNLKSLKVLDISNTPFGSLDSRISQLENIEVLRVNCANLQTVDFSGLCKLTNLRKLDLYGNYALQGSVPAEIFKMPNLEVLDLSYSKLSGTLPSEVWRNDKIKELCLGGLNNMRITLPSEIKQMKSLEVLYLSSCDINGSLPVDIGDCSNIRVISMDFTNLSGIIPAGITKLRKLESFAAIQCDLSGTLPVGFVNCPNLSNLQLSRNNLTGGITADLAAIESLWLYGNKLSGSIPREFIENSKFWRNNWGKIYVDNNFDALELGFDGPDLIDYKDMAFHEPFYYADEYSKHELTVIFQFTPNCQYYEQAYDLMMDAYNEYGTKGLYIIGRTFTEHAESVGAAHYPWPVYWTQQTDYPTYVTPTISFIDKNGKLIFSDLVQDRAEIPAFLESYFASQK